jgi:transposase
LIISKIDALQQENAELREANAELRRDNAELRARVEELEEKLRSDSSNSSKPPSSDPPWADPKRQKRTRDKGKRKPGGQPGHEGNTRDLLPPDQVDEFVECHPPEYCSCGGQVACDDEDPQRLQNLELPESKAYVTEFLIFCGFCERCGRLHLGKLPSGAPAGVLGPRAMAVVAILSGKYHLSKRQVEEVLQDLLGIQVSLGTVSNTEARVSAALEQPVEEAKAFVREQAVVYADETGHKVAGKKAWMWTAVTAAVSVFLIRFSRGARAAKELLGATFGGVLVSDRWGAYNWVDATRRQLCWSHLIRDLVKIEARGGRSAEIASAILDYVKEMFVLWHTFQEGKRQRRWLQRQMKVIREEVENLLEQGTVCGHAKTQKTCQRILKLKNALWTYVDVPSVEPTNNSAERTIRPYVLWRKVSFGTQSERGNLFVERMMTVSATCRQQNRNVLEYVTAAVRAYLRGEAVPSLLPQATGESIAVAA